VRRSIMIALIALLALALAAPTVLAQNNGGQPQDINDVLTENPFDFPAQDPDADPRTFASLGCDFPLRLELSGKSKTINLPDGGSITIAPGQYVTVTNLDTGESVTYNITGVTFSSAPDEDGIAYFVITGRNLAFDPAGTFLNIGRFTFAIDTTEGEEFPIVQPQQGKGQAIDVCALLS
jgi:hypothetical protein